MSPLTEMREGIRMNAGRGNCPRQKQEGKPKWHAEICYTTTKRSKRPLKQSNWLPHKDGADSRSQRAPAEGQSEFINQGRQRSERQEGKCRLGTGGSLLSLLSKHSVVVAVQQPKNPSLSLETSCLTSFAQEVSLTLAAIPWQFFAKNKSDVSK